MQRISLSSNRIIPLFLLLSALAWLPGCPAKAPEQRAQVKGYTIGISTSPHPAELGDNRFMLSVHLEDQRVSDAEVALRMFMPGMPMNSDAAWIPAKSAGGGRYTATAPFSMGGHWEVAVRLTPKGKEPVFTAFPFDIKWELK